MAQGTVKATIVFIDMFSAYIKLLYLSVVFHKSWVPSLSYMKAQPSLSPRNSHISNINVIRKLTYYIHKIVPLKISEILPKGISSISVHCALIYTPPLKKAATFSCSSFILTLKFIMQSFSYFI